MEVCVGDLAYIGLADVVPWRHTRLSIRPHEVEDLSDPSGAGDS